MRKYSVALSASLAVGLSFGAAANAASISFNDKVPGEITINHDGNFEGGATSNGTAFSPFQSGSTTANGEVATFSGTWIASNPGTGGTGVIYFVDPEVTNVVCARMDATWSVGTTFPTINFTLTSAPAGSDLGTIPAHFAGLGIPITTGFSSFSGKFRNPATAAPVSEPSNMGKTFASDAFPKCADSVLLSQPPDQLDANHSDLDATAGTIYEQAEDVVFGQDVIVRSVRWWGIYAFANTPPATDDFVLRVYEDAAGVPAASPIATYHLSNTVRGGTTLSVAGFPEFIYAADLPAALTLQAGKTYWLAIVNNTTADADDNWFWERSSVGNDLRAERTPPDTGGWSAFGPDRAIELCGVPCTLDCQADLTGDGVVDGADLAQLLAFWGVCPAPAPFVAPEQPRREILLNTQDTSTSGLLGN